MMEHTYAVDQTFGKEILSQMLHLQSFARGLCKDPHSTDDLVQDTMLKALRYFHTYREGTNSRAWLFQICKNSFINTYRRKKYEPVPVDFQEIESRRGGGDGGMGNGVPAEAALTAACTDDFGDEVMDALSCIPTQYQSAVLLSDVEGFTYEEIALLTHVPIGTIRSRIHRGRKLLAAQLALYAHQQGCFRASARHSA